MLLRRPSLLVRNLFVVTVAGVAILFVGVCATIRAFDTKYSYEIVAIVQVSSRVLSWDLQTHRTKTDTESRVKSVVCVTNTGSRAISLNRPNPGSTVRIWYRLEGETNYSTAIPPGTIKRAQPTELLPRSWCKAEYTFHLDPGFYYIS